MEMTYDKMPDDLMNDILMQGTKGKSKLIDTHKKRIRKGQRSILFGLTSFGEGLDLPADFCQLRQYVESKRRKGKLVRLVHMYGCTICIEEADLSQLYWRAGRERHVKRTGFSL